MTASGRGGSALLPGPSSSPAPNVLAAESLAATSIEIQGPLPGFSLHLQHRAPAKRSTAGGAVLLVHGGFFPASAIFDADLRGGSALAQLAAAGLSAYTLDLRGYGGSTRPAFMSQPIRAYQPFATTEDAVSDVAAAVAFVRERERVNTVSLVGWSWGTSVIGTFAIRHPALVHKVVLYAPLWVDSSPATHIPFGNYRTLDRAEARRQVLHGVPPERVEEIHSTAQFDHWWALNLSLDPEGASRTPPVIRAPCGVTQDYVDSWSRGTPTWKPEALSASTLVIVGEWDRHTPRRMAEQLYAKLTGAATREIVAIPEGTHFLVLEKNRDRLIANLVRFLNGHGEPTGVP